MDEQREKLSQLVEDSTLTPESKAKAGEVIADESKDFPTVKQEVITLIAEEIDNDLDKAGAPEITASDTNVMTAKETFEQEVAAAENDLQEDTKLVEDTLTELGNIAEKVQTQALSESLQKGA